jgi:hypothetical protein
LKEKVKKIFNYISIFVATTLVLPVSVFASPKASPNQAESATVSAVQLVKVISVQPTQSVVLPASSVTKIAPCSVKNIVSPNWVQGAGAINLNQPASCFAITPAHLPAPFSLSVTSAHPVGTIVVARRVDMFNTPALASQPLSSGSALPIMVFTAFDILAFEQKKSFNKIGISVSEGFKKILTVYQLQVIRC